MVLTFIGTRLSIKSDTQLLNEIAELSLIMIDSRNKYVKFESLCRFSDIDLMTSPETCTVSFNEKHYFFRITPDKIGSFAVKETDRIIDELTRRVLYRQEGAKYGVMHQKIVINDLVLLAGLIKQAQSGNFTTEPVPELEIKEKDYD